MHDRGAASETSAPGSSPRPELVSRPSRPGQPGESGNRGSELSAVKRALLDKYACGNGASKATELGRKALATPSSADPLSLLVPVQPRGTERPLFYLHVHWEGGAFYGFPLASALGTNQPFYVLDPYRFESSPVLPRLEDMAAVYVTAMRSVQPHGPYAIAGFCGGCLIGFEIAQQLRAAGDEVDMLAFIEPGIMGRMTPVLEQFGPWYLKAAAGSVRGLGKLLRLSEQRTLGVFLYARHVYRLVRYLGHVGEKKLSLAPSLATLRQDWNGLFSWICSAYVPRPYGGPLTYLWAKDDAPTRRKAWDRVGLQAAAFAYEAIAGTHDSCRNADLPDLAAHLSMLLARRATGRG